MLKSSLCGYSDAYILVKEIITIIGEGGIDAAKREDKINKRVIF